MVIELFKKVFFTFGYTVFAVTLAWLILFVSISRTSLAILARQNGLEKNKSQLIALANPTNGTNSNGTYKLPEVSTLPTNVFYGLKVIRDYLWLTFSSSSAEKARISLFLADKKMAEMYALIKTQQSSYALEAATGALEKLRYSQRETDKIVNQPEVKAQSTQNLAKAGVAYRQMVESLKSLIDLDQIKYSELTKGLDDFNQEESSKITQQTL
ncbi:DUF5667 domain-containing protein [Patescibacteria group bacterium]|nr:DUF5667 domain-containing protein [Patescibacteria group bacterium]